MVPSNKSKLKYNIESVISVFPSSKAVVATDKKEITLVGLSRDLSILIYMESFPLVVKQTYY